MSSGYSAATSPHSIPPFKGKSAHRSWPQLPEELVRSVISLYATSEDRISTEYQACHELLSMGPRSHQLLSIYMGCSQIVASQDGLYLYTRLDRARKEYHVSLCRMAQSE